MLTDLYRLREKQGHTQRSLAAAADISNAAVHNIENALCSPTVDTVTRLARALDMPAVELFALLIDRQPHK